MLLYGETSAEPFFRALFQEVLKAGGHPHLLVNFSGWTTLSGFDEDFLEYAGSEQLEHPATFYELAYQEFDSRVGSTLNRTPRRSPEPTATSSPSGARPLPGSCRLRCGAALRANSAG